VVPGAEYQALRSDIARRARNAGENHDLAETLNAFNNSLDTAVERGIAARGGDPGEWAQARADYRKVLTIEGALKRGNAENRNGLLTPEALESAAKQIYGTRAYLRGDTPFGQVATALAGLAPKLPNSGTESRHWAHMILSALGAGIGLHIGGGGEHGVHGLLLGEQIAPIAGAAGGYLVGKPALSAVQPLLRGDFNPRHAASVLSVPGLLSTSQAIEQERRRRAGQ
jgi:hypothetical protein